MTSNTETMTLGPHDPPKAFTSVQVNALSPFKHNGAGLAAFKPLQAAKPGMQGPSSSDLHARRFGFQLVANSRYSDKENTAPMVADQKKRLQSKIVTNLEQKTKPPTDAGEAQFLERTKTKNSFSLRQFNSILLGRRPKLDFKTRPRGSVFQIKSSKPTHCTVTVKGLTIQVKIAN